MHKSNKFLTVAALLIVAVGVGIVAHSDPAVGQAAPPLVIKELNGQLFNLSALRGKVVVVNFWATWCPPCRAELPMFSAYYQQHHDDGVEIIGISEDERRARKDVRKMAATVAFPMALASDVKANGFGAPQKLPVTYVLDRTGVLRTCFPAKDGAITEKELNEAVAPLLPR